jgi:DNA-binding response OmpR family regulator
VNPHILFVDDEAPIREMLSLFFRKKGFTVTTAMTGDQARELVHQTPFNLAIVDIGLAGENGLDLLKLFKKEYPKLPVIIFTGLEPDDNLIQQIQAGGADGFMRKTQPLSDLFAEVQKHLS